MPERRCDGPGDESRPVALRQRAGAFRSTKNLLRPQIGVSLAGEGVRARHAPRGDPILRQGRGALNVIRALPSLPVTTAGSSMPTRRTARGSPVCRRSFWLRERSAYAGEGAGTCREDRFASPSGDGHSCVGFAPRTALVQVFVRARAVTTRAEHIPGRRPACRRSGGPALSSSIGAC